jgi:Ribonuclease III domain
MEGILTLMKSAMVNTVTLADIALEFNMQRYVRHRSPRLALSIQRFESDSLVNGPLGDVVDMESPSFAHFWARGAPKALADVVEAVIGAVYVDGGWEAACALVHHLTTASKKSHVVSPDRISCFGASVVPRFFLEPASLSVETHTYSGSHPEARGGCQATPVVAFPSGRTVRFPSTRGDSRLHAERSCFARVQVLLAFDEHLRADIMAFGTEKAT